MTSPNWSQPTTYGGLTLPSGATNVYGSNLALLNTETWISYIAPSGTIYYLSGPAAPLDGPGVLLNSHMGILPPWKMLDQRGARQDGGTWTDAVYDPGDIQLHLEVFGNSPWEMRNTMRRWISDWDPKVPGILSIFTPEYGEWWAYVRMAKTMPDMFDKDFTHAGRQQFTWEIVNYNAFWNGPDSVSSWNAAYNSASVSWSNQPNSATLGTNWTQIYSVAQAGTVGIESGTAQFYYAGDTSPTFSTVGAGSFGTTSGTSFSWNHNILSNTGMVILIPFIATAPVSSVTVGGVNANFMYSIAMPGHTGVYAFLYALLTPPMGSSESVVVTLSSSGLVNGNSVTYSNTYGFGSYNVYGGQGANASLPISAGALDTGFCAMFSDGSNWSSYDASTRWNAEGSFWGWAGDAPGTILGDYFLAVGGSNSQNWCSIGIDLQPIRAMNNVNIYNGTSVTNNQVVNIEFAGPTWADAYSFFVNGGFMDIWGRLSSNGQTGVRLRIAPLYCTLSAFVNGIEHDLATFVTLSSPSWNDVWTLVCGTAASTYQYQVLRNGTKIYDYTDSAQVSQVGSSNRGYGFGEGIEVVGTQQFAPPPIQQWYAGDNIAVTRTGTMPLTNIGDCEVWPRYLLYGPGTFGISNGPGSATSITFGELYDGQIALITTDPRLPSVVDMTPNTGTQVLSQAQEDIQTFMDQFAVNGNLPPLLQQFESLFGILPPQGNFYSLLNGRFTNPMAANQTGTPPQQQSFTVSLTNGGPASKIVAAVTPQRRWPL